MSLQLHRGVLLQLFDNPLFRSCCIGLTTLVLGISLTLSSDWETRFGLDLLFKIRGSRQPPEQVVIVAMDEESDTQLDLAWDFSEWRRHHARLLDELKRQQVKLIIFDLQFIAEQKNHDTEFARAIKDAGNVLTTQCVQTATSGREQCSKANKTLPMPAVGQAQATGSIDTPLRIIPPNTTINDAVVDKAFFVLPDDPENPVRASWLFVDQKEISHPTLPVLAWFYALQRSAALSSDLKVTMPISAWLGQARQYCFPEEGASLLPADRESVTDAEREIVEVVCGEADRLLDLYGPPATLRTESYIDVLNGKVGNLQDKVVFVGVSKKTGLLSGKDAFWTIFTTKDTGKISGVEIMATQFANLTENRFIKPWPPIPFVFLVSCISAWILVRFEGITGLCISLVMAASYASLVQLSFNLHGIWLPVVVPMLQLFLAYFMALILAYLKIRVITAENNRLIDEYIKRIKNSSGQDRVQVGIGDSTAKLVFGICLATDVKGYTTLAEKNPSELLFENLREYFKALCAPVSANGGEIANITGDSLMAIWRNLPIARQQKLAALATVEMEEEVERFNKRSALGAFPTRIGLHQGEFTTGSFVEGGIETANPVGDTVNTASRIEGLNKKLGTQILASADTVEHLDGVLVRPVGRFQVVGRHEAMPLVEIVGKNSDTSPIKVAVVKQFAEGLRLFQHGDWKTAHGVFSAILALSEHDGPSRYYLERCDFFLITPPENWQGFIILDSK